MKISDLLKKLGIDLDKEVDESNENKEKTEKKTSGVDNDKNKNSNIKVDTDNDNISTDDKSNDNTSVITDNAIKKEEVKKNMIPKYDTKTGLFDLSGIEDGELKAVLKLANDTVKTNKNSQIIAKAIDDKLGTVKLADGITKDAILTLLDRSGIKVTEDGVTGINEAFDSLKSAQAGLFKVDTKDVKSNPILEGFNPQGNTSQTANGGVPNSFVEAFSIMEN